MAAGADRGPGPSDPRHGTLAGYSAGCRCPLCRAAYREYWDARKGAGDLKRGPWTMREVGRLAELYREGADAARLVADLRRPLGSIRAQARRQGIAKRRKPRKRNMSINRVNISGNLTRDPELRATAGGTQVLSFGVAVNDRRRNQRTGEWEDYPNFVDVTMFGNRAEALSRILAKGMKVAIDGSLRYSSWERDGQKRSKLEVIADEIEFMSRQQDGAVQASSAARQAAPAQPRHGAPAVDVYDEDIPF